MVQLQFLNRVLSTKDYSLISNNNLSKEYFSDYTKEYSFIVNHYNKYKTIPDKETFIEQFPSFTIIDVKESDAYLVDGLIKDYQTRYLATSFNSIRKLLLNNKTDEAVELYESLSSKLQKQVSYSCVDLLKDTARYNKYVERMKDYAKHYVRTGFLELDKIIGGWDREEDLVTIIGKSNYGKTWILLKCVASAVEQNLNVGLYSGEMSDTKVGYRIDTLLGHINNKMLVQSNSAIQNTYKTYIDSLSTKFKGTLKVLTPSMINGPAGVTALKNFIEKENLDILFIDQHSLLEDDRGATNPTERASNISRDLKNLQVLKSIPIVSVSQQNRTAVEDNALIDLTQIAQSYRIAQDSTVVIAVGRDKKDSTLLSLQLIKSRDTENGIALQYKVDFNTGEFIYIPNEKDYNVSADNLTKKSVDNDYYAIDKEQVGEEIF